MRLGVYTVVLLILPWVHSDLESNKSQVAETLKKLIGVLNDIVGKIDKRDEVVVPIEGDEVTHIPFKNLKGGEFLIRNKNCKTFMIPKKRMVWQQSVKYCEKLQSKLISITNEQEFECVKMMNRTHGNALAILGPDIGIWISGTLPADKKSKEWIWSTAVQKFTFTVWAPGKPDNFLNMGESCAGFYLFNRMLNGRVISPSLLWDDYTCSSLLYPICEV